MSLMTMATAAGQTTATTSAAAPAKEEAKEEIVVTGSYIARTDLESTVPIVSLSATQLQATGITNLVH
jgi:hypothetical protein